MEVVGREVCNSDACSWASLMGGGVTGFSSSSSALTPNSWRFPEA